MNKTCVETETALDKMISFIKLKNSNWNSKACGFFQGQKFKFFFSSLLIMFVVAFISNNGNSETV